MVYRMHFAPRPNVLAAILFLLLLIPRHKAAAAQENEISLEAEKGRFLEKRDLIVPVRKTADLFACFDLCRKTTRCGSANYKVIGGDCELNRKNHLTHPKYLDPESEGYMYLPILHLVRDPNQELPKVI